MYVSTKSAISGLLKPRHRATAFVSCAVSAESRRGGGLLVRLAAGRHQLLRRHRLLVRLGQLDDKVDDLFLEDRGAQIVQRVGVVAVVIDHLALVAGMA